MQTKQQEIWLISLNFIILSCDSNTKRLKIAVKALLHRTQERVVKKAEAIQVGITKTFADMELNALQKALPSLPWESRNILETAGVMSLSSNTTDILNCAMILAVNYVTEATTYAESCGGGGANFSGWGHDKNDDDERWWLRCITKAATMVKPVGRSFRRGR